MRSNVRRADPKRFCAFGAQPNSGGDSVNYRTMQVCITIFCLAALCVGQQQAQPQAQPQPTQPAVTQQDLDRVQGNLNKKLNDEQGQIQKLDRKVQGFQTDFTKIKNRQTEQENRQATQERRQAAQDAQIRKTNNAVSNLGNDQKSGFRNVWYGALAIVTLMIGGGIWFFLNHRKQAKHVSAVVQSQKETRETVEAIAATVQNIEEAGLDYKDVKDPYGLLSQTKIVVPPRPLATLESLKLFCIKKGIHEVVAVVKSPAHDLPSVPCILDIDRVLVYESLEQFQKRNPANLNAGLSWKNKFRLWKKIVQPSMPVPAPKQSTTLSVH